MVTLRRALPDLGEGIRHARFSDLSRRTPDAPILLTTMDVRKDNDLVNCFCISLLVHGGLVRLYESFYL